MYMCQPSIDSSTEDPRTQRPTFPFADANDVWGGCAMHTRDLGNWEGRRARFRLVLPQQGSSVFGDWEGTLLGT